MTTLTHTRTKLLKVSLCANIMKFVSQLYTGRFLLLDIAKTYSGSCTGRVLSLSSSDVARILNAKQTVTKVHGSLLNIFSVVFQWLLF